MIEYRQRLHAFSPEMHYQLHEGQLTVHSAKGNTRLYSLKDVRSVHLRYAPTRVQRQRYLATIRLKNSRSLSLSNEHYRGVYDFEDRSADYRAFLQSLCRELAQQPNCTFHGGNSPGANFAIWLSYFAGMGLLLLVMLFLAATFPLLIILQIAIMLFYTPALISFARRNKSQTFDPQQIHDNLLP